MQRSGNQQACSAGSFIMGKFPAGAWLRLTILAGTLLIACAANSHAQMDEGAATTPGDPVVIPLGGNTWTLTSVAGRTSVVLTVKCSISCT